MPRRNPAVTAEAFTPDYLLIKTGIAIIFSGKSHSFVLMLLASGISQVGGNGQHLVIVGFGKDAV